MAAAHVSVAVISRPSTTPAVTAKKLRGITFCSVSVRQDIVHVAQNPAQT